ncbi:MAG: AAA family ATPase [Mucinivorans sp.]
MYSKIVEIDVRGLLGSLDLTWHLTQGVNILAGGNGTGKSTLLRAVAHKLRTGQMDELCSMLMNDLQIQTTEGPEIEVLTNFDEKELSDGDFLFDGVDADQKIVFYNTLDRLFHRSGKHALRGSGVGGSSFLLGLIEIPFRALSSGERHIFRLLYNILTAPRASVLILDEPEISLQIDWQKVLLEDILKLNPNLQILLATHSPAIVMNGWVDCVSEISSLAITTPKI